MTTVFSEIGIALAFFVIPLWAFGIYWEAFVTGAVLVGLTPTWLTGEDSVCVLLLDRF